ncbi:hypothetical protein AAVH_11624 [Aphelenchoides avenae]|nr:hypothetical protein AAVH_11624 [Aphelenchus avenae]
MERLLACGPLGERIAKDPAHMAAYVKFVESNKGLKKADFNVKFVKELAPSLSAEVQAMLTPEAGAKIHADMAAKEATLSEPAKALYQKFKVLRENQDITMGEELEKSLALIDSDEYKTVAEEFRSKGFPMPK